MKEGAALTVALHLPVLNAVAAVLLGAGYGFVLTYSLGEVARLARPGELAGLTAAAYALIYVGMFMPPVLARLQHLAGLPYLFCGLARLATCALLSTFRALPGPSPAHRA
ncbi:hypothetical protein [Actinomadura rubrisoli]|uniref:MFS transporter n=1 Tax=Actinomadura rubrisoli TaxID=2530368 RepID=A0A4R5BGH0_9ACTN|nr:hypothetical protein [Actinomadura rubrisoli]TDD82934.1 hypothetical protein E1298_21950 [Actinomadura rubrisoli]